LPELLFEIGLEELPASFIEPALKNIESFISQSFTENRIQHGEIQVLGAPRRLTLVVHDVAEKQENLKIERLGPIAKIAFDENNNPTKAAIGFARSMKVSVEDLKIVETPKGAYTTVSREEKGKAISSLLPELLTRLIETLPFKKSMRWADQKIKFARPVHWIIALFAGEVIPVVFGNIKSGNITRGHRFYKGSDILVSSFEDYSQKMREAYVILDIDERHQKIKTESEQLAESVGGQLLKDPELLDELSNIAEYPTVTLGNFDEKYLSLPDHVLVSTMKGYQKYFSIVDAQGKIMPHFIVVNNSLAKDHSIIRKGNERVLIARLNDARFFYTQDQKIPLAERTEKLKFIRFHAKLGNMHDKIGRLALLAEKLLPHTAQTVEHLPTLQRGALLCKADLTTEMVYEFPELQGLIGTEYAKLLGEKPEVANCITEHYLPLGAEGQLPESLPGALLSITDKIDTLCGFFAIKLWPKGSGDPFGLRRAAIGLIRIIIDQKLDLPLDKILSDSFALYAEKLGLKFNEQEASAKLIDFIKDRFRVFASSQYGYSINALDAVIDTHFNDVYDSLNKTKALLKFKEDANFMNLAIGFKRVVGILSKIKQFQEEINPECFQAEEETNLFHKFQEIQSSSNTLLHEREYEKVLHQFALLKDPIDRFFEEVIVMADQEDLKNNRLKLLREIADLFFHFGDISRIAVA